MSGNSFASIDSKGKDSVLKKQFAGGIRNYDNLKPVLKEKEERQRSSSLSLSRENKSP